MNIKMNKEMDKWNQIVTHIATHFNKNYLLQHLITYIILIYCRLHHLINSSVGSCFYFYFLQVSFFSSVFSLHFIMQRNEMSSPQDPHWTVPHSHHVWHVLDIHCFDTSKNFLFNFFSMVTERSMFDGQVYLKWFSHIS